MTEPQLRALTMCEINFYRATFSEEQYKLSLKMLGWKTNPQYDVASLAALQRLAKGLRSVLRSSSS